MAGEVFSSYDDIDAGKVLNKVGLLELSGQIKGYIDANVSSSGSSNNLFPIYVAGLVPSCNNLSKQEIIAKLLAGEVVYNPPRGTQITSQELANHSKITKIGPFALGTGMVNNSNTSSVVLNNNYYYYYLPGKKASYQSYEAAGVLFESGTGMFGLELPYADNQLTQTKTPYYLQLEINKINGRVPVPSTTDGTYKLNCVVSSGSPTYNWATDSGSGDGTTYTAGTGITISGNTISADSQLPTTPSNDGTYMLKCVVSSGSPTYSWESVVVGGNY